jgi:NAD(P)-dependent dehydrogenase (short-subunit alcohol dehydrogenase family)
MTGDDRVALVTGSSSGIGAAVAELLGASGFEVTVTCHRDEAGGRAVVDRVQARGGTARLVRMDVTRADSVRAVFDELAARSGRLDLLVQNAVREVPRSVAEATLDEWQAVLESKLDGAFLCTQAALPLFARASRPSMIVVSSYEAERPRPLYPAYGVANAGLNAFVKAMAVYLPKFGARCNAIVPGPVRTPIWGTDEADDDLWSRFAEVNPVGRNATVEDVARTVLWLADEPTRMVNGSFVYVNGGTHLRRP